MIRETNRKPPAPAPSLLDLNRIQAARAGLLIWMSAEEAAEYLGVSLSRFREAASKGEFERYKDIGGYRYHRDDLDEWRRAKGPLRAV